MSLLVLAYPIISLQDFDLIQQHRMVHDKLYYSVVMPHFTIVFADQEHGEKEFIEEIRQKSSGVKKFDFTIRCATARKDAFIESYNTVLVPDEGYSQFIKLHDLLYSGLFAPQRRLDIDFIPHISIGNAREGLKSKRIADEWNSKEFSIEGQITGLSIVSFENNTVQLLEEIKLI